MKKKTKKISVIAFLVFFGMIVAVTSVFAASFPTGNPGTGGTNPTGNPGGSPGSGSGTSQGIVIPDVGLPDPPGGVEQIVENFLLWLLSIIGIIAIISFVISGFQYFMAAGDEKQMEVAKRNLNYSILGIIVALSGFVAVKAIDAALNAKGLF